MATAPISTAPSPRLEISTRGGYGSQRSSSGRTSASSSAFAPMPPPSTTSPTSVTAAIGAMCSAIRRASSLTTSRASASPARAAAKIERASKGDGEPRLRAVREALREARERRRAGIDLLLEADRDVVELAGRAVMPALQLAAQHEPGAEARADGEEHEVVDAAARRRAGARRGLRD